MQLPRFDLRLMGEKVRLTQTIVRLKDNDRPTKTRLIATSLVNLRTHFLPVSALYILGASQRADRTLGMLYENQGISWGIDTYNA